MGRGDERKALGRGAGRTGRPEHDREQRRGSTAVSQPSDRDKPRDSAERDEKPLLGLSSEPSTDLQRHEARRLEAGQSSAAARGSRRNPQDGVGRRSCRGLRVLLRQTDVGAGVGAKPSRQ